MSLDPTSKECFTVAKSWIYDCLTSDHHKLCQRKREESLSAAGVLSGPSAVLPSRLIDVGPHDGSQEPKLILSSDIEMTACRNYAALSHCWGGTQLKQISTIQGQSGLVPEVVSTAQRSSPTFTPRKPLVTLSENLVERMERIPMKILPKTFQDSVTITRNLGLRYIWIDSLCIIQDSKSDWEQEAAQMADTYKNSYVTIAAESSQDSHEGILNQRILDFSPIEIPFHSRIYNLHTTMYIRPALDDWDTCIIGPKSKLCSRAWVLQESLLAPRTIHFTSQQMMWECRSRSLAEGDMSPIPPNVRERSWSWSQNKRFLAEAAFSALQESSNAKGLAKNDILYLQWYSILRDYSNRKLTFPSDIFPALAGLATEFNRRLADQYVAGLWARDLHRGLLWRVEDSERAQEAHPYRAPTWSWASIMGEILDFDDHLHLIGDYRVKIIQVQTIPAKHTSISRDGSCYKEITAGTLRLQGRWCPCSRWPKFEEEYYRSHIIPDPEADLGVIFRYFDVGTEERYLERHNNRRNLSLLEIATWVYNIGDTPIAYFLILESGNNGDESFYRRVGVVVLQNAHD